MRYVTHATRLGIDPDGVLADDNHAHEQRWFNCDQTYGDVFVGEWTARCGGGSLLKTAIDALSHGMSRGEGRTPVAAACGRAGRHGGHPVALW